MNLDRKNLDSSLDRLLGLFNTPSSDQLDASREHMQRRLNTEGIPAAEARVAERQHLRYGGRFVFAGVAAAILLSAVVPFGIRRDRAAGATAVVESSETEIYRVSNNTKEPLSQGAPIDIGDTVSSNGKDGAVVSLKDGSRVEMRSQTEFSVERAADGVRLNLRRGSLIVNASKQPTGHLFCSDEGFDCLRCWYGFHG